jgi:hypothetical protein
MTHKGHGYLVFSVEISFKREDNHHLVNELPDLPNATRSPCPYLRADIIHDRDIQSFCGGGEHKVKVRKIDEYEKVRPEPPEISLRSDSALNIFPAFENASERPTTESS